MFDIIVLAFTCTIAPGMALLLGMLMAKKTHAKTDDLLE